MTAWQRLEKALPECGHWDGAKRQHCRTVPGVRRYVIGWRCPDHTPAAMAGRPEPRPGPGMPAGAWATLSPLSASRVYDARAVASGKRRSSPNEYRAAQAAVTHSRGQVSDMSHSRDGPGASDAKSATR